MPGDRIGGSGSIPPNKKLEPDALWSELLKYFAESVALRSVEARQRDWNRWWKHLNHGRQISPYLKRFPDELATQLKIGFEMNKLELINAVHGEFLDWYFKEDE